MSIHGCFALVINFCRSFFINANYLKDFKVFNATLPQPTKTQKWQLFPNGFYKAQFKYWNKEDEKIFQLNFRYEERFQGNQAQL